MLLVAAVSAEHTVTIDVPAPELLTTEGYHEIYVPGMTSGGLEDFGQIPCGFYCFPIPPDSDPSLEWRVEATTSTNWGDDVVLSSVPEVTGSGFETRAELSPAPIPPEHSAVSMDIIHLLGSRVALVKVSPFCFGSTSTFASRIAFSLSYRDAPGSRPVEGTLFEHLAPEASAWWPTRERSPESFFWGKPWARVLVDLNGFYSITCQELEDAGCSVAGTPSASLAMYSGPSEMFDPEDTAAEHELYPVAISVHDGGDGFFNLSDSLVFYGRDLWHWNFTPDTLYRTPHRYDDANTYWLTWGGGNGERIQTVDAQPSGGTPVEEGTVPFGFEEEVLSDSQDFRTGWLWGFVFENTPGYFYLGSSFQSDNATLNLSILKSGITPWVHNLVAELDGNTVLDTLNVVSMRYEHYSIENVSVSSGGNLLKVWSDWHGSTYLDFAELLVPVSLSVSAGHHTYVPGIPQGPLNLEIGSLSHNTRIFDLSDPYIPVELDNWNLSGSTAELTYDPVQDFMVLLAVDRENFMDVKSLEPAQPGRLIGTSPQADVLITVPQEFLDVAQMLQAIYSSRDKTVLLATYREIYDEFGQGVSDPGALRSFVRWALDTWDVPPVALLIVGDGSDDPLGYSTGFKTTAPIYFELPSGLCLESFFTTVHQGMQYPEIPVSRIPAGSAEELATALQKSWQMQSENRPGSWENTLILAADDEWGTGLTESEATEACEFMADTILPRSLDIVKHYLIEYPWPPGTTGSGTHPEKPEAAQDLIELLNAGVSSFTFFGHGSYDQMASEKLMSSGMVTQLTNAPRYFLYNSFSCNNGEFSLSAGDCLAEVLLFHQEGGAAVAMACAGLSLSGQNRNLAAVFFEKLYGDSRLPVSDAFWLSVVTLGQLNNLKYCVLGDGGITVPMGQSDLCEISVPDTLFRGRNNVIDVEFPQETTFLFRCRESADTVTYVSPLTQGFSIDYLRYGSPVYQGINATNNQGTAQITFFMPLQADTGSMGRTDATGAQGDNLAAGYTWPVPVADDGNHVTDTEGPLIELVFKDYQEGEVPSVYQNAVLSAELSDPSGICVLGGDAGSIIICSIDGEYEDVTELFAFHTGSSTSGSFEYSIPDLLPGRHQVRVVARDGMKNTGEEILSFDVLEGDPPLLEETGVYPNPSRGTRAFFFTTGSSGSVEASVYTIAGRPVWRGDRSVSPGTDQIIWNGLDSDGDPLAAGTYIYMLRFTGNSRSASVTDLLVVTP